MSSRLMREAADFSSQSYISATLTKSVKEIALNSREDQHDCSKQN